MVVVEGSAPPVLDHFPLGIYRDKHPSLICVILRSEDSRLVQMKILKVEGLV